MDKSALDNSFFKVHDGPNIAFIDHVDGNTVTFFAERADIYANPGSLEWYGSNSIGGIVLNLEVQKQQRLMLSDTFCSN